MITNEGNLKKITFCFMLPFYSASRGKKTIRRALQEVFLEKKSEFFPLFTNGSTCFRLLEVSREGAKNHCLSQSILYLELSQTPKDYRRNDQMFIIGVTGKPPFHQTPLPLRNGSRLIEQLNWITPITWSTTWATLTDHCPRLERKKKGADESMPHETSQYQMNESSGYRERGKQRKVEELAQMVSLFFYF